MRLLRSVPLFATLDETELHQIAGQIAARQVPPGALVTLQGHSVQSLFIVAEGRLKRFKVGPAGREQTLDLLETGAVFPLVPVLEDMDDPATTRALDACILYAWPRGSVMTMVERSHPLALAVMHTLARRVYHLTQLVEGVTLHTARERVARLLLTRTHEEPRLTHAEIAAVVGTTREGVVRALRSLETTGAVSLRRGRASVLDPAVLEAIASGRRRQE